jgi:hypothetical protein
MKFPGAEDGRLFFLLFDARPTLSPFLAQSMGKTKKKFWNKKKLLPLRTSRWPLKGVTSLG